MHLSTAVRLLVAVVALLASLLVSSAATASHKVSTGTQPWLVVPCRFVNSPAPATTFTSEYYRRMFSEDGIGAMGLYDYWRHVSFGQLSTHGTRVTEGWTIATNSSGRQLTRDQWGALPGRRERIEACANGVAGQVDFSRYWGVAVLFPEARTWPTQDISATTTTIPVASNEFFPSLFPQPPFNMTLDPWNGATREVVRVTARNGNDLTVIRGRGGTTARAHNRGTRFEADADFGAAGVGKIDLRLRTGTRHMAAIVLTHGAGVTGAAHEMGHGFGLEHSLAQSDPTKAYTDCTDLMSAMSCVYRFTGIGTWFGGEQPGDKDKGPGLAATMLDKLGWIPSSRRLAFDNSIPNQQTITLRSLSDRSALSTGGGFLQARIPASVPIGNVTTSDYYTLEYREKSGWDSGFAQDSIVLHLHGRNGRSYWVDSTPLGRPGHGGRLYPGDQHADLDNGVYVAVHSKDLTANTARVTIASRKITPTIAWVGANQGTTGQRVTLAARLSVSGAPAPGERVTLSAGTQSCLGIADATGRASCTITLNQSRGTVTRRASYNGDVVYNPVSTSGSFRIYGVATRLTYNGPTSGTYGVPFRASGVLARSSDGSPVAGRTVTFTLGSRSCSSATDAAGTASCMITPALQPSDAPYQLVASFGGDATYEPSRDQRWFYVRKIQTQLTYTGPTTATNNQPATFRATLRDAYGRPIANAPVAFELGTDFRVQGCTGHTDAYGNVACTVDPVWQPSGSRTLVVRYAGDSTRQSAERTVTIQVQ